MLDNIIYGIINDIKNKKENEKMYEEIPITESKIKSTSIFNLYDWIEYNTDQNFHTENIVIIAMRFGDSEDIENAKYVMRRHKEETCMTQDLKKFRDYIFEKVMSKTQEDIRREVKKRL